MTERDLDTLLRDLPKKSAVAALVGYCTAICNSGDLGESTTKTLRQLSDDAWNKVCTFKEPA